MTKRLKLVSLTGALVLGVAGATGAARTPSTGTETPIQHVVVIFQENVSFDHYFGTYPNAENPEGEPVFAAKPGTPSVNGLSDALLVSNPNGFNPFRLDRADEATCDQDHGYRRSSRRSTASSWTSSSPSRASAAPAARTSASARRWSWATTTATR